MISWLFHIPIYNPLYKLLSIKQLRAHVFLQHKRISKYYAVIASSTEAGWGSPADMSMH